jgi:hypothetical protein
LQAQGLWNLHAFFEEKFDCLTPFCATLRACAIEAESNGAAPETRDGRSNKHSRDHADSLAI